MKLNFRSCGAGSPVIILHGLLGSLDNWVPHAQMLAAHFQVFLLDLRNHGRSPHAPEFNYDVMAADVAGLIHDHKLSNVNLLGHSMGGKVAMRFAQLYPEHTQRLLVVDMAPREYAPRYAKILETMATLDLTRFQQRNDVDAALTTAAPDKNIRQFLLKNLGRREDGGLTWKPNMAAIRANYASVRAALPTAPRFSGPTLFLRGGKSDYLRDEDVALIRQIFPNAAVETIAAAGHWVHAEAPEEFLRHVTEFFSAHP